MLRGRHPDVALQELRVGCMKTKKARGLIRTTFPSVQRSGGCGRGRTRAAQTPAGLWLTDAVCLHAAGKSITEGFGARQIISPESQPVLGARGVSDPTDTLKGRS